MTSILIALASASMAVTVAKSRIFEGFRYWLAERAEPAQFTVKDARRSRRWRWVGDMLGCPYCTSHWFVFAWTAAFAVQGNTPNLGNGPIGGAGTVFATIAAATAIAAVLSRAYNFAALGLR